MIYPPLEGLAWAHIFANTSHFKDLAKPWFGTVSVWRDS